MKKLLFILFSFSFTLGFSQSTKEQIASHESEIYEKVDQMPEFPNNGIAGFRNEFVSKFSINKVSGKKGAHRTVITFIVERDGTICCINASGLNESLNNEAIEAIKKIETKWRPGMIKATPVRCRFRFPVTMNID